MKVWRVLQGRLKKFWGALRVFHRGLKGISRKFQGWFSQVLGVLQECFKEISRNLRVISVL